MDLFSDTMYDCSINKNSKPYIIGGDFHSSVVEVNQEDYSITEHTPSMCHQKSRDAITNYRGRLLTRVMESEGFLSLNGRTPRDSPAELAFIRGKRKSTIDLIWINIACPHFFQNSKIITNIFHLDHLPSTMELKLKNQLEVNKSKRINN